jgi:hypothetical protein
MRAAKFSISLVVVLGAIASTAIAQQCPTGKVVYTSQSPTGVIRNVVVAGGTGALPSGLVLRPGFAYRLTATGSIRVGVFGETGTPPEGWEPQGPAGSGFPAPDAFTFSLLYRVGSNPWRMLARGPFLVKVGPNDPAGSPILFGINDNKLNDNTGSFTVTIAEIALIDQCVDRPPVQTTPPRYFGGAVMQGSSGKQPSKPLSGSNLPCAGKTSDGRKQGFQFPLYCSGTLQRYIPVEACTRAEALAEAQALAKTTPPNCVLIP